MDNNKVNNIIQQSLSIQKRFKNIEQDRRANSEETLANFKKQKNLNENLQKENKNIKEELIHEDKMKKKQIILNQQIKNATEEIKLLNSEIEMETEKCVQLEDYIKTLRENLHKEKASLGGINATKEGYLHIQKQIRILENRLDKANQKFNEAIAYNQKLRENIDSLRRERHIFDSIYKKMERELHEKRTNMAEIIEDANKAYEERDRAQEELVNNQAQSKKEEQDFDKNINTSNNLIEKEYYAKDKGYLGEDTEEMKKNKAREEEQKYSEMQNIGTTKQNALMTAKKILQYRETFAKIEAATEMKNINDLVNVFQASEEKNFQLFKYVNNLSNDIETQEAQINEMKQEIEKYEGKGLSNDERRKGILHKFEEELSKAESKEDKFEAKCQNMYKILDHLQTIINQLFNSLDCKNICDNELIQMGLSESTLLNYLNIIEKRRFQIMSAYTEFYNRKLELGETPPIITFFDKSLVKKEQVLYKIEEEVPMSYEPPKIREDQPDDKLSDDEEKVEITGNINEFRKKLENMIKEPRNASEVTKSAKK